MTNHQAALIYFSLISWLDACYFIDPSYSFLPYTSLNKIL